MLFLSSFMIDDNTTHSKVDLKIDTLLKGPSSNTEDNVLGFSKAAVTSSNTGN